MSASIPLCSSPLATHYERAKHCRVRKVHDWDGSIDTITIHCYCAQVTAEQGCSYFANIERTASTNYIVGTDGSIGVSVPESERSICTCSTSNDARAVTIETASDGSSPYAVNDVAFAALVNLVTDICKRNNIKKLIWSEDATDRKLHRNGCNMTVHRDYPCTNEDGSVYYKSCPGDYLYERHGQIAAMVNSRLAPSVENFTFEEVSSNKLTVSFTATEAFKDYTWSYQAIPLVGEPITKKLSVKKQQVEFSITGLTPNMMYDISIITEDEYENKVPSAAFRVFTTKDFPNPPSSVELALENSKLLGGTFLNIQVQKPSKWCSVSHDKRGYRAMFFCNGSKVYSSDTLFTVDDQTKLMPLVKTNTGFVCPLLGIEFPYESTIQIGIQTWVSDDGLKVFNNTGPVFSDPIYIASPVPLVDKLFVKAEGIHQRLMLYGTKISQ